MQYNQLFDTPRECKMMLRFSSMPLAAPSDCLTCVKVGSHQPVVDDTEGGGLNNVTKLSTSRPVPEIKRPEYSIPADDLVAAGKRLRDSVPRASHGVWKRQEDRADPIGILHAADAGRIPELVPIRYGRMLQSPFTFYRGSADVMAADLATTPTTGVRVQPAATAT